MIEGSVAPVKVSVAVSRPPADVFRVFTEEIEKWWPVGTHSIAATALDGKVKTVAVHLEGRVGRRIYERMSDGKEATWGTIRVWDPPTRILFSWKPNFRSESPTEVEVRFVPQGAGTRVDLEHRGWEELGADGDAFFLAFRERASEVDGRGSMVGLTWYVYRASLLDAVEKQSSWSAGPFAGQTVRAQRPWPRS